VIGGERAFNIKWATKSTMHLKQSNIGFTLLEVLIATTIFSLVATALYTTFRVGVRAYESGEKEIVRMQHARVIFDTISRDLRSVYSLPETSYNKNLRNSLARFEQLKLRAETEGRLDEFLFGDRNNPDDQGAPNPYDSFIEINLDFKATDGGGMDSMTFVRYQYDDGVTRIQPWSLGRITYSVENGELVRTEEDVFQPRKDKEGNVIEEKLPRREVLARGLVKFDVHFGYFRDGDWMESDDWDSTAKRYRNPMEELDEEDPLYQEKSRWEQMKPVDGLPAFVRVKLEIEDEGHKRSARVAAAADENADTAQRGSRRIYSSLIRIPTAQENYIPSLDKDMKDER